MRFLHTFQYDEICGRLAQLGEHLPYKEEVIGSIPIATTSHGSVAQLVEQLTLNQLVHGSSPCGPTIDSSSALLNKFKLEVIKSLYEFSF